MNTPLIIAHRGNVASAPENTLEAIREAIEIGSDCIEVDVRCTKDMIPVLMHDPAIGRTTNGRGNVAELTLEEIRGLEVNSEQGGERIPTLEEAILEVRGKARLVAEVKVDCTEQIAELVNRMRVADGIFFSAFRLDLIQKLYRSMPSFDMVWLLDTQGWVGAQAAAAIETASESEVTIVAPSLQAITESSVCCAHEVGLQVWTWCCEDEEQFRKALSLGVDAIITGNPGQLIDMVKSRGPSPQHFAAPVTMR
ncbi:MAG TPA: glycerophosphodiester phosphodiesterase [Planctomycetota bacterium]|nr:glycerophosphodiester phosphodiesterase [Planctomycetota bacterium]